MPKYKAENMGNAKDRIRKNLVEVFSSSLKLAFGLLNEIKTYNAQITEVNRKRNLEDLYFDMYIKIVPSG